MRVTLRLTSSGKPLSTEVPGTSPGFELQVIAMSGRTHGPFKATMTQRDQSGSEVGFGTAMWGAPDPRSETPGEALRRLLQEVPALSDLDVGLILLEIDALRARLGEEQAPAT